MPKLYIVATPIGNLQDITLRALEVFKSVDAILCEDTRVTAKLLNHYQIKKRLLAYHQHSRLTRLREIIRLLEEGSDLALVTDSGTPGIQDPGGELIRWLVRELRSQLISKEIKIIPLPGPSALATLLSASGLKADEFLFLGFLPKKKGRTKKLEEMWLSGRTVVFYESGRRIITTLTHLTTLARQFPGKSRWVVVGRELTKVYETIYWGSLKEVVGQLKKHSLRGEFVVAIGD